MIRYFKDKEALFEAAVRSKLPPFMDPLDGLIDGFGGSTKELLLLIVRAMYVEIVDSDVRVLMRIILSEGNLFPELTELYFKASVARGRPVLEKLFARGVQRGEIRPDHARLLPMVAVAPAIMASIWKMTFDRFDPIATEDFLEAHIDLLIRGLFVA